MQNFPWQNQYSLIIKVYFNVQTQFKYWEGDCDLIAYQLFLIKVHIILFLYWCMSNGTIHIPHEQNV